MPVTAVDETSTTTLPIATSFVPRKKPVHLSRNELVSMRKFKIVNRFQPKLDGPRKPFVRMRKVPKSFVTFQPLATDSQATTTQTTPLTTEPTTTEQTTTEEPIRETTTSLDDYYYESETFPSYEYSIENDSDYSYEYQDLVSTTTGAPAPTTAPFYEDLDTTTFIEHVNDFVHETTPSSTTEPVVETTTGKLASCLIYCLSLCTI